ncbi:M35 family metallo-endopeptidase [Shewanella sp. SR44-3]|uniref:M35 family metallo-endopeptidase n=1 Tax=unclassified Shewanella TaxID=196818 RepID=UPI0015FBF26D|nr:M35 family metallo-endopeptidase [Shewanella sp. SR44-3]MBB1268170.1 peptidase M35 [Shewanella sp. SR44-3]
MIKKSTLQLVGLSAALLSTSVLADGVRASLAMDQQSYASQQDVYVTLTLTNEEPKAVKLLKWYTAVDGVEEALFKVSVDGQEQPYLGAHYKRPAPTIKDYIKLKSGESVSYKIELSSLYDMSQTGNYDISYDVSNIKLLGPNASNSKNPQTMNSWAMDDKASQDKVATNSVNFYLEGRQKVSPTHQITADGIISTMASAAGGSVSFTGRCSNSEQSSILSGLNAARSMASNAKSYMQFSSPTSRYNTWFGSYSSSRWSTVANNFSNIDSALNNQPLTFDCSCNKSYFAYVYPTQPYKVYLCNAFWSAPTTGTDSKGGTIVHELSHFNIVAGTDDIVYGQSGAKSLAISNPSQAIKNADSHEYFAENTPFQN